MRRPVFQLDAGLQLLKDLGRGLAAHAHSVLAFDFGGRMHQAIRQFTIGGEQQQAGSIDIEPANCNPASPSQFRQGVENCRAAFRIMTGANLAQRFVIGDHAQARGDVQFAQGVIIKGDFIVLSRIDLLAQRGDMAIDLDASKLDPFFNFTSGTIACAGDNFL